MADRILTHIEESKNGGERDCPESSISESRMIGLRKKGVVLHFDLQQLRLQPFSFRLPPKMELNGNSCLNCLTNYIRLIYSYIHSY